MTPGYSGIISVSLVLQYRSPLKLFIYKLVINSFFGSQAIHLKLKPTEMKKQLLSFGIVVSCSLFYSCSDTKTETNTSSTAAPNTKETFPIANLVAENKQVPDSVIAQLNAQHHQLKVWKDERYRARLTRLP